MEAFCYYLNKTNPATENDQNKEQKNEKSQSTQTFCFNFHAFASSCFLSIYGIHDK